MSVIVDFAIFPTDKGESVSAHVARAARIIKESGLSYKHGPMGTSIEGEWDQVMDVVNRCFHELEKDCRRIYTTFKADYRQGAADRLEGKVRSLEAKI